MVIPGNHTSLWVMLCLADAYFLMIAEDLPDTVPIDSAFRKNNSGSF
jgi:hypothetical protein